MRWFSVIFTVLFLLFASIPASADDYKGSVLFSDGTFAYETVTIGNPHNDSFLTYYEGFVPGYSGQLLYDPYNRIWVCGPIQYRAASLTFNGQKEQGWVRSFGDGSEDSRFFFAKNGHVYQRVDVYHTLDVPLNSQGLWMVSVRDDGKGEIREEAKAKMYSFWVDLAEQKNGDVSFLRPGEYRPTAAAMANNSRNLWGYKFGNWRDAAIVRPVNSDPLTVEEMLSTGLKYSAAMKNTPANRFNGNVLMPDGTYAYNSVILGNTYKDTVLSYYEGSVPGYDGKFLYDPYNRVWVSSPVNYNKSTLDFNGNQINGWVREFGNEVIDSGFFFGENGHVYQRVENYRVVTSESTANMPRQLRNNRENKKVSQSNNILMYNYWVDLSDRVIGKVAYLRTGEPQPSAAELERGAKDLLTYEYGNWKNGVLGRPVDFKPYYSYDKPAVNHNFKQLKSATEFRGNVLLPDGSFIYNTITIGNTQKDTILSYYEGTVTDYNGKLLYDPYNQIWVTSPIKYNSSTMNFNGTTQKGWVREFGTAVVDSGFFFGENGHVYQRVDFYESLPGSSYNIRRQLLDSRGDDQRGSEVQSKMYTFWVDLADRTIGEVVYLRPGENKPSASEMTALANDLWTYEIGNWRNGVLVHPDNFGPVLEKDRLTLGFTFKN